MFNRTIVLMSASLAIIIVAFTFFSLYIAFDQGVFVDSKTQENNFIFNGAFYTYIIFVILMLAGAITNFIAYNKQSINILVLATLFFILSCIPAIMFNMNANSSDPYLFAKLCAPSVLLNFIQMIFIKMGVKNYKSGLNINKKKKKK